MTWYRLRAPACGSYGVPRSVRRTLALGAVVCALSPMDAAGGPPYVTDDPEPVAYRHWEIYLASTISRNGPTWSGTAPHLEVNYGARPDIQLHLIAPAAFTSTPGSAAYGYGDTELGIKLRLLHEGAWVPQAGLFTLVELPTGNAARGLGLGYAQVFLPLWVQKSVGPWQAYGGGGLWLEGTPGHQDYAFLGGHLERKLGERLALGAELFHLTARPAAPAEMRFNAGAVLNLDKLHHILLSAGRGVQGPNQFQGYIAYQLTFGPKRAKP